MGLVVGSLTSSGILSNLSVWEKQDGKDAYTPVEYMDDVYNLVMEPTLKRRDLNHYERVMQYNYILSLMMAEGKGITGEKGRRSLIEGDHADICSCSTIHLHERMAMSPADGSDTRIVANAVYHYGCWKVRFPVNFANTIFRCLYKIKVIPLNIILKSSVWDGYMY